MADQIKISISKDWEAQLAALLPLYGHRNWIVVADAAYPAQCKLGIETIVADAGQLEVVRKVLIAIAEQKHIRAKVHLDQELAFVPDEDAQGVSDYREKLHELLADSAVTRLPHDAIIARLDQSAQVFRVLIIKTEMLLPYTSVFFELDCGYWNAEAEQRLRERIVKVNGERDL